MYQAIGMFSGGLDSILAAKIMLNEGLEVIALHFYTGFNGKIHREISEGPGWKWKPAKSVVKSADKLSVRLVASDVSEEYIDVITHPRHGYGSAVNPCIDCRIFLLKKARELMAAEQAVCIFTGEVMGQRPMSQHKPTLQFIEKKAEIEGRLLRPLSAKLLEPTIPEKEGIVNRDHLYGFSGRSRKQQKILADKFGIDWYPNSGGGCILTDKSFGRKFVDFCTHTNGIDITLSDLNSLKTGRHLRLKSGIKVISGRNKDENHYLRELLSGNCWRFDARDFHGSAVFALGEPLEEDFREIAAICARYSKGLNEETVTVIAEKGNEMRELTVKPADQKDIEPLLIR